MQNTKENKQEINTVWACNECNFPNFTASVSDSDIENELLSCINCGGFEFHKIIK